MREQIKTRSFGRSIVFSIPASTRPREIKVTVLRIGPGWTVDLSCTADDDVQMVEAETSQQHDHVFQSKLFGH